MRKYKKGENISICPESLRRIIDGVNHLPVNADEILGKLIELAQVVVNLDFDKFHAESKFYRAQVTNLNLEKEVLDYLIGEMSGAIILGLVAQNFNELILAKPVLQGIAEINREEKEQYGKNAFSRTPHNLIYSALAFNQGLGGIRFSATLKLSGGSFIRPNLSGLPLVFESENIPPERIRKCPVCQSIFWAKRFDAKTCGEKECVKTLGGNKYQSDNKDKLNENKRRKYYVDNDIEYCPVCVFPLKNHDEFDDCPTIKRSKNNGTL